MFFLLTKFAYKNIFYGSRRPSSFVQSAPFSITFNSLIVTRIPKLYRANLFLVFNNVTLFRQFSTTGVFSFALKNPDADLSDQYFFKDRNYEILMRLYASAEEKHRIIVCFSYYWKVEREWFKAFWMRKTTTANVEVPPNTLVEYPSMSDTREIIEQYPTECLRVTKYLFLTDIMMDDYCIRLNKITLLPFNIDKNLFWLEQTIDIIRLANLFEHFELVVNYYKTSYNAPFKDLKSINFSTLRIKNRFAGNPFFLKLLNNCLFTMLQNVALTIKTRLLNNNIKYGLSNPMFLSPIYSENSSKSICEAAAVKQIPDNLPNSNINMIFNYGELPYEIVAYLTSNIYISIEYKQDMFDILYQFFFFSKLLNPPVERPSVNLTFFKKFVNNKDKFLTNWCKRYNIEPAFGIFVCEQYLRGHDMISLIALSDLKEEDLVAKTPFRGEAWDYMSITDVLVNFKSELLSFIFSFYYRQCYFTAFLNNTTAGAKEEFTPFLTDKTNVPYGLLDLTEVRDAQAALYDFLAKKGLLDKFLSEKSINYEPTALFDDLEAAGFPSFIWKRGWNFNNVFLLIEKLIQKAFFDSLIEIFPHIKLNTIKTSEKYASLSAENQYATFFLHRDNKKFFIPKAVLNLSEVELQKVLLELANKVEQKTGYKLTFQTVDLVKDSEHLEKILKSSNTSAVFNSASHQEIDNNITFFINEFTKNISFNSEERHKNAFLEFDEQLWNSETSQFFLSWLEIDLCIHSYFPTLSLNQIQAIRFKIMEIFQKNKFRSTRTSKSDLINSEKLKIYLETKGFISFAKDRPFNMVLRGIKGIRLKQNIFHIILDKYL
jgi:hypothetical protein